MWEEQLPSGGDELRQGDVLADIVCTSPGKYVTLAPIRKYSKLSPEKRAAFFAEPEENAYVIRAHAIEPVEARFSVDGEDQLFAAEFEQLVNVEKSNELHRLRIARMTIVARLQLRDRLSLYWGRPEAGDEEFLSGTT
jgi:hypothetical protein